MYDIAAFPSCLVVLVSLLRGLMRKQVAQKRLIISFDIAVVILNAAEDFCHFKARFDIPMPY